MMSKQETVELMRRWEITKDFASELYDAAQCLIERHDKRAKHTGFQKCGCADCKPFREIIEGGSHAV